MNNKEKFVFTLTESTQGHLEWVKKINSLSLDNINPELIEGPFNESSLPLWIKTIGNRLSKRETVISLVSLNKLITDLDAEYSHLINLFTSRKKSFWGKPKSLTSSDEKNIKKYLKAIEIITQKILFEIKSLLKVLSHISNDNFGFINSMMTTERPTKKDLINPQKIKNINMVLGVN